MTQPTDLYDDMATLNSLYEELCWSHDAEIQVQADYENDRIIISLKKDK